MSRIERKHFFISTSYLAGLFDIFILLHIWQNSVCLGDFLPMRTLCDCCHEEFESHYSVPSLTYLLRVEIHVQGLAIFSEPWKIWNREWCKTNLREVTLVTRSIWGITSLTLHPLLEQTYRVHTCWFIFIGVCFSTFYSLLRTRVSSTRGILHKQVGPNVRLNLYTHMLVFFLRICI